MNAQDETTGPGFALWPGAHRTGNTMPTFGELEIGEEFFGDAGRLRKWSRFAARSNEGRFVHLRQDDRVVRWSSTDPETAALCEKQIQAELARMLQDIAGMCEEDVDAFLQDLNRYPCGEALDKPLREACFRRLGEMRE